MTLKHWWYGSNGPAYKLHRFRRWVRKQLGIHGLLTGNCAGCGKVTNGFDPLMEWHICSTCPADEVAYNFAEYVSDPN